MKKFKSKKIKKRKKFYLLFYIVLIYLTYQITSNIVFDFKLEKSNEEFIIALLNDSKELDIEKCDFYYEY